MESEADICNGGNLTDNLWNREMLFIFIVWRIPISLCRTSLQPPLHTAVYSQLRLAWLIYFLSSVNRVQCEAYHKRCSEMCLQPQQCQQIGFRGQTISWEEALLAPHREKERTLRRQEKIIYEGNIWPHHIFFITSSDYSNVISAVCNIHIRETDVWDGFLGKVTY